MLSEKGKSVLGIGLITLSLILITFGIYRDEISTVFYKAINICMECIGIG